MGRYAWVTLATNDTYALGALVLAHSLKQSNTCNKMVILVTPGISSAMREILNCTYDVVYEVDILDSKDESNLRLLGRPELGITFTKIHCWKLTQYEKCVFLDADTMVMTNVDDLFEREEISAAPDVGWPDCFNTGVFVYRPSVATYNSIVSLALEKGSFDGGDQGLLNWYFSGWSIDDISKHLPFIYNVCSNSSYTYFPAFNEFGEKAKIVHFISNAKPWNQYFDHITGKVEPSSELCHLRPLLQRWWDIFCSEVHPLLTTHMSGLVGTLAGMKLDSPRTRTDNLLDDHFRRQLWETGNMDYMGRDSFTSVWKKISETLADTQASQSQAPQVSSKESTNAIEDAVEVGQEDDSIVQSLVAFDMIEAVLDSVPKQKNVETLANENKELEKNLKTENNSNEDAPTYVEDKTTLPDGNDSNQSKSLTASQAVINVSQQPIKEVEEQTPKNSLKRTQLIPEKSASSSIQETGSAPSINLFKSGSASVPEVSKETVQTSSKDSKLISTSGAATLTNINKVVSDDKTPKAFKPDSAQAVNTQAPKSPVAPPRSEKKKTGKGKK